MTKEEKRLKNILINNIKREWNNFSKYACKSRKGSRQYPEIPDDRTNIRPVFFVDTDKIIHSNAYARYIGKTQVFAMFKSDHITHRVLHVQFVSKIARIIGRCLKLNEDLLEAISLGHDLGHVPYGHEGEKELDAICQREGIGYFCHNAQSVRVLKDLELSGKGLNLSLQVYDGILSHNGEMLEKEYKPVRSKTWKDFETEYHGCFNIKNFSRKLYPMTLEGCVVRIADIISYIGRDIEDAANIGLISWEDVPIEIKNILGHNNMDMINTLVMDLVDNSYNKPFLKFSSDIYKALWDLKQFNYENIYYHPVIKTESDKIGNMFQLLFDKYCHDIDTGNKDSAIFIYYLNKIQNPDYQVTDPKRIVIDFIAGMTDDFFNSQFQERFMPAPKGYNLKKEQNYI